MTSHPIKGGYKVARVRREEPPCPALRLVPLAYGTKVGAWGGGGGRGHSKVGQGSHQCVITSVIMWVNQTGGEGEARVWEASRLIVARERQGRGEAREGGRGNNIHPKRWARNHHVHDPCTPLGPTSLSLSRMEPGTTALCRAA